jgi:hypothetical protein
MPPSADPRRDPRVDAYIAELPDWQQAICSRLRDLIHRVDPEMSETIKRSDRPYFVLDGNVCALLAAKDHVNLFLYDGSAPSSTPAMGSAVVRHTMTGRSRSRASTICVSR